MNADRSDNTYVGQARNVIQAAAIHGGVHSGPQDVLPMPRQLPRTATCFMNRTDAITRLDEIAATENGIVTISGPAGVGKTALAVFWAHRARERFYDGQLYVNLRGYDRSPPLRPAQREQRRTGAAAAALVARLFHDRHEQKSAGQSGRTGRGQVPSDRTARHTGSGSAAPRRVRSR